MSTVAVLTAAIPERAGLLAECVASVNAQTRPPELHVIGVDHQRVGCSQMMNRLVVPLLAARFDWVAPLADDDLFYPDHLATLLEHSHDADVVYSWCDVTGRPGWNPNAHFDPDRLRQGNYIPSTALIRCTLVEQLGGWQPNPAYGPGVQREEDWMFWLRALDVGARFVCVPRITWAYRFQGDNQSWRAV